VSSTFLSLSSSLQLSFAWSLDLGDGNYARARVARDMRVTEGWFAGSVIEKVGFGSEAMEGGRKDRDEGRRKVEGQRERTFASLDSQD